MTQRFDNSKGPMWQDVIRRSLQAVVPVNADSGNFAELLKRLDDRK